MRRLYYKVDRCLGCKSCEIACAVEHTENKKLISAINERSLPRKKVYFFKGKNFPLACLHCQQHPCVDACIAAALFYDEGKGLVLYNQQRCVGCWMCVMVCPYGAIRPDIEKRIPIRCDKCKDKDQPACVRSCPTGAIILEEEKINI